MHAYSQDLRDRVIDAVVFGGMSRRAAGERFGVSESVAIKWVERFERTGSRTPGKMGGHRRLKLEPHREFRQGIAHNTASCQVVLYVCSQLGKPHVWRTAPGARWHHCFSVCIFCLQPQNR